MVTIKELPKEEYLLKGHAACAGCGSSIALRLLFKALGNKIILVVPACCTTVIQGPYPYTSSAVPLLNILFESCCGSFGHSRCIAPKEN
jgi:pyruvate ferredoxin oxidoreductase beta subunit